MAMALDRRVLFPHIMCMVVLLAMSHGGAAIIGINWGRRNAQRLVPSQVVDLLLQNGITHARVYSVDDDILCAFYGSGINLTVTISEPLDITSEEDARMWVQKYSPYFGPCSIKTIYMGGYVFGDNIDNRTHISMAMNSLMYLQNALNEAGHQDIKAAFLHYVAVLKRAPRPSDNEFRDEIKVDMATYLRFLQANNAPFVIEGFPLLDNTFDPSFSFADNKSPTVIKDINGAVYRNHFEHNHDCFLWALKKQNASDLKIIVAQTGWPTDGLIGASVQNAERYYKYLLPLVAGNKGTPMRPGVPIDTYVHALTDENRMDFTFARHWGIYRSNGEPKYRIDLSGQGRDMFPTTMKGIMRMPDRWCVFGGDLNNSDKVKEKFEVACAHGDCSSVASGASCGGLSYEQKVSYAFNMYFQFQFQDERACDFGGLAHVAVVDPSTDTCLFPVEVVRGHQINYVEPLVGNGSRDHRRHSSAVFFVLAVLGYGLL